MGINDFYVGVVVGVTRLGCNRVTPVIDDKATSWDTRHPAGRTPPVTRGLKGDDTSLGGTDKSNLTGEEKGPYSRGVATPELEEEKEKKRPADRRGQGGCVWHGDARALQGGCCSPAKNTRFSRDVCGGMCCT